MDIHRTGTRTSEAARLGRSDRVGDDAEGTLIKMRYEGRLSLFGQLLSPVIRRMFARECEAMLDNWQNTIEARTAGVT